MPPPPAAAKWFQDGFHRFLRRFLRRHFHTIAIHAGASDFTRQIADKPLIVYGNHPSWWDPLIAQFLCRAAFPKRQFYAPIDAQALARYPVFRKLGFFGITLNSTSGAAEFLRTSSAIISAPHTSLWLTPEGRFADARDHEAPLMPGLAHLCWRMPGEGYALPLALEYVFWEERLPECLLKFGAPIERALYPEMDKQQWHHLLTERLRDTQRELAQAAIARRPEAFELMLSGRRGAGGFYDTLRRLRAWITGTEFHAEHGRKFNP